MIVNINNRINVDNIGGTLIIDDDGAGMTRDQYRKSGI